MDSLARSLLRPTRRTTRAIAALVVVALVGWLGVSAGHLHLPGDPATHAYAHAGTGGHVHFSVIGLDAFDCPDHGDHHGALGGDDSGAGGWNHGADGPDDEGDHPRADRAHPCSLCLSLDRGAGPSAPPAIVVAILAATFDLRAPDDVVASVAAPTVYRSRAPPAA